MQELFDTDVMPNNWCKPKFNNVFTTVDDYEIEIGMYKEEDGELTLQIFKGDDVVFCETIGKGKNNDIGK